MQDLKYVTLHRRRTWSERADVILGVVGILGVLAIIATGILDRIGG